MSTPAPSQPHPSPVPPAGREARRLGVALATAVVLVATALALPSSGVERTESLRASYEASKAARGLPHTDPAGTPLHTHDPRFKNALARGGESGAQTLAPADTARTRAAQRYVARERALPDPTLTTTAVRRALPRVPTDRFAMAGGCYTLTAPDGTGLRLQGRAAGTGRAQGLRFQATDLGRYLLYAGPGRFVGDVDGALGVATAPSSATDWIVTAQGEGFAFRLPGGAALQLSRSGARLGDRPTPLALRLGRGCAVFPESQIDITGRPFAGTTSFQEVRGFVDAHTHGMAFEFLGGRAHCGRPWHPYGVTYALVDCPDHAATGGYGAALETFLSGEPSHDPVGWPTFKDWPAPESLTHEGTYYRWMERAWRGGQRLFVNLLVENNKLCQVYPLKKNSCDDMDSIRLQARRMYEFQDYIDAQFGGPGRGFYRIVTDPFQARRVINAGKMAVVMGIETSVPFGCTFKAVLGTDVPACTAADITRQIGEMHRLGVRQMELVNKFDNALGGVAGDNGTTGVIVNGANFLETGTFWDMRHCEPADGESADKTQYALPDSGQPAQDALFGAVGELFGGLLPATPLYPAPLHCNRRGLTGLGEHTIRELVRRGMIFDPDHLSVKARQAALDVIERVDHPGVISSHSWSTADAYPRIYRAGGFITPYAGDSTGFVDKWRTHVGWADERYYWGIGFGADINGLGAQGDPRGADVRNPVTYPFTGLGGVRVSRQHAGRRVYDINRDGVAQYGLYPDWIEDLTKVAGRRGADLFDDMARGTEAYLQMWERSVGVAPDSCRNPDLARTPAQLRRLVRPGMTTTQVLRAVGQPYRRLGRESGVCVRGADAGARAMATISFSPAGRVIGLRA
ncbi:hypothetical protein [Nocardioides sp.]|uniref:hypothetical protein n=1 Tax=Nocardioides sp. TaxID=35761 RepID=UPI003514B451